MSFFGNRAGEKGKPRGFFGRLVRAVLPAAVADRFFGRTTGPRWTAPQEAVDYFSDEGNWHPTASSNIEALGYFASVQRGVKSALGVRFLNGTTYYYDLPRVSDYLALRNAPSRGKHLHWQIKVKGVPYDGPH